MLRVFALAGFALALHAPARAQVFVSSVTAALPDSAGKVPGFNKVPGSAIENWVNGVAQVVLTHGQSYNYCVSFGTASAKGTVGVTYSITRSGTVIQSGEILPPGGEDVGSKAISYVCSGYTVLPDSPGKATLTGTVAYTATGKTNPTMSKLATSVMLK